ncbi:hypothetical protein AAC387_Pa12g0901 [Persea americana]
MEMRAEDEIDTGQDVTPEILPLAFSLSETFLSSHCSTCSFPLPNPQTTLHNQNNPTHIPKPYAACAAHPATPLLYCSLLCRDADADRHRHSADCHLLQSHPSTCPPISLSDLRAALRLLLSFETLGFFPALRTRIAGLMTNQEKFAGDEEILAGIREGGRAMAAARRMRDGALGFGRREEEAVEGENEVEEAVLGIVLTNAVEVQVRDGLVVGTAVYGPRFSWFNHSCRPNACYRFALGRMDGCDFGESDFRVFACGKEDTLKTWISDERILDHVSCKCGPRVIVRSIRPIRKGEEVCIAYLDLLQPMETLASLKASCSSLDHGFYGSEACKELTYRLDQAVEDVAEGNPKACCERLEKMLAENFQYQQLPPDDPCQQYFGARCSTGKTLLSLLGSPTWSSAIMKSIDDLSSLLVWSNSSSEWMPLNDSKQDRDYGHSSHTHKESTISGDRFDATCKGFLNCISRISVKAWPFLIHRLPFLKDIKSPIDFRWLGIQGTQQTAETQFTLSGAAIGLCSQNEEGCQHRLEAKKCIEGEERKSVFQLAAHSLLYGRYLASICYGPDFCLTD